MVRVREPSYGNICLSLLHSDSFLENHIFDKWDAIYILLMNKNYCPYLTCVVWRPGECESRAWKIYVYVGCDLLLMLLLMTLIDMWWCWYVWWYWYEVTLLMMIMSAWIDVTVDDYVNVKWGCCCCWQCHRDEMMFMLRMILKWNVDDVGNALR